MGACDHLRDALEIEFEPEIAAAISQIEGGADVDLGALAPDPFAFDEAPESGIDADLFGMELVVEEDASASEAAPIDAVELSAPGPADGFEANAPRIPSKVRYRGVAPPPPVHRSRSSDSWLAHQDTIAPLDEPDVPFIEPATDGGVDDLDDLDDWDLGGSANASASTAKVERQQVGFDDLSGAMQPSGHLPGMRDAFVEPEFDDGDASALPAEIVPESGDFIDDPVSPPPAGDISRPPVGDGAGSTRWLEVDEPQGVVPGTVSPSTGSAATGTDPDGFGGSDPFDAFGGSSLAQMLDDSLENFGPAPVDAGAAATFDVRMHSRPRQPVVPHARAEDTRPGEAVVQEDARPTRPATAPLRWEPDVEPASRIDSAPEPGQRPQRTEAPARTGRTLSGWRSGPQWAVPDEPTPTAEDLTADDAAPAGVAPVAEAGPSDAHIEATRAAFARQASNDRRTDQGRPAGMAAPQDVAPAVDPARLTQALMEVSDLFIVGELDRALERLDDLTEWSDHPDVVRFREEIDRAREQRLAELVDPVTRVPMANANADAAALAALNPRRMFIVSLADGMATIEDLIDMSGMPTDEARRAIGGLIDSGVLVFDE